MTFAERVDAVVTLGFSHRHATFLTLVLLNGGYFVRRQYCAFAGVKKGMTDFVVVRRLLSHRLARAVSYSAQHGHVYRLCGRPLYAAADLDYPLTRGEPSQALVARRLMLLDFVVTEPNLEWYTTPKDKCDLFAGRLGLPETLFPRKTRKTTTQFWPEDLPVFLLGQPPQVQFVCLATDAHASGVGAFVRQHAALLQQLSGWTLHVVAPRGSVVDGACEKAYERALHATVLSPAPESNTRRSRTSSPRLARAARRRYVGRPISGSKAARISGSPPSVSTRGSEPSAVTTALPSGVGTTA